MNTENQAYENCDFLCEQRLLETDPALHKLYQNGVFAIDLLLTGYKNIFPFFTNHTLEHSEQVIHYCNLIAGPETVSRLNADELYILLMGALLHDVGMGVSEDDFRQFRDKIDGLAEYQALHPGEVLGEYVRVFHQDFSAEFIRKYAALFEIPSEEAVFCIARIAKGHRNAPLLDREVYPENFRMPDGNTVNLPYLAALVKLADELDVASDRNLFFDYSVTNQEWSENQAMCFKCHAAIKSMTFEDGTVTLRYDTLDPEVDAEILKIRDKVEHTFNEYREVVEKRTTFSNRLRQVRLEKCHP